MASAGVRSGSEMAVQQKVRFSSIQYHDPITFVDKETETVIPAKSAAKQRYFKYAQNTDASALEGLKNAVPSLDSKVNVDHQHYEQWARVPNKRVTNSILLRGIQQLKARAKREALEEENRALSNLQSRNLLSRETNEVSPKEIVLREVYQRDGLSRLGSTAKDVRFSQKDPYRKDLVVKDVNTKGTYAKETYVRESSTKENDKAEAKVTRVFLRFKTIENVEGQADVRQHTQLPSSVQDYVYSSPNTKHVQPRDPVTELPELHAYERDMIDSRHELEMQTRSDNQVARELIKSRYGIQKLRERSPFPVSIKQQKYYGEPMFLVSDPYKYRELPKSKTRMDMLHEVSTKADNMNGLRPKLEVTEIRLPVDSSAMQDEFYRSKSFIASFPSKKHPSSRTPAQVPSADFCDISQLEDAKPRHSAYANLLERSRTESAFSCKTPHLLKWVPRVQRMKELLK